jgi:hypothetical protein
MAKALLSEFRIGGDVIDRVASHPAPETELLFSPYSVGNADTAGGEVTAESPPAGGVQEAVDTEGERSEDSAAAGSELRFEREGLFHLFTVGEIAYRIGGVRQLFVTSLKVNIRASSGGSSYYDSLDLYAAKARTGFAQAVARTFGAELARVEKDLVLILEHLERERDAALKSGNRKAAVVMSSGDRELGLSLLRDPDLFERIVDDMTAMGYVGEDLNKQLVYLAAGGPPRPPTK